MDERRKALLLAAVCALVTLVLVVAGFPYERLATRVLVGVEAATGARITHAGATRTLGWTGPVYTWSGVHLRSARGAVLEADRLSLRLAASPAWLRGVPTFDVAFDGPAGGAEGTVQLGSRAGFAGELRDLDLAALPRPLRVAGLEVSGRIDGQVDLAASEGWAGRVAIAVRDGSLRGAGLADPLPFGRLAVRASLAPGHRAEIAELELVGPLLRAHVTGRVGPARTVHDAPLDLALEIDADPRAYGLLRRFGIRVTREGPQTFRVDGRVAAPRVH